MLIKRKSSISVKHRYKISRFVHCSCVVLKHANLAFLQVHILKHLTRRSSAIEFTAKDNHKALLSNTYCRKTSISILHSARHCEKLRMDTCPMLTEEWDMEGHSKIEVAWQEWRKVFRSATPTPIELVARTFIGSSLTAKSA